MSDPTREPLVGAAADRVRDQLTGAIDPATAAFLQALNAALDVPPPATTADTTAYLTILEDRVRSVRASL
ncbi:hypothetical protein ACPXCX_49750, partial [Streptomyces sp. DT225]